MNERRGRTELLICAALLLCAGETVAWAQPTPAELPEADEEKEVTPKADPNATAYKVRFRDETLLEVRAPLGRQTVAQRGAAIQERVNELARRSPNILHEIRSEESRTASEIYVGETRILSIQDADAFPMGRTRRQLAADYRVRLRAALAREFEGKSLRGILFGTVYSVIATVVFLLLFVGLRRLYRRLIASIRSDEGVRIKALQYQGFELLSAERLSEVLVALTRLISGAFFAFFFYLFLERVLSFFPWTRGIAQQLLGYVISAADWVATGFVDYLPNVVYIVVIVVVTRYVLRLTKLFFGEIERKRIAVPGFVPEWASPTYKIVRLLILALSAVIVFPYLPGSDSPAFQGVSIFIGVLFSLGSTSAIANVVAGLVLTYMLPFRVGDRVKIADTVGDVVARNLLVVRVKTVKNVSVTIPNAMVLNHHIINYSAGTQEGNGVILHAKVTIGYDVPWVQVHELLIKAAKDTKGLATDPTPFVFQTALDDYYVHYEINAFTKDVAAMGRIYSDLYANIQDQFNDAEIEILSPHYRAQRDGSHAAIPDDYLPKDYESPPFRILPVGPRPARPASEE